MGKLTKPEQPDRSKININDRSQVKALRRKLGVSKTTLTEMVEKVGNSAAEVRLELQRRSKLAGS